MMPCTAQLDFSRHSHICSIAAASVQHLQLQHKAKGLVSLYLQQQLMGNKAAHSPESRFSSTALTSASDLGFTCAALFQSLHQCASAGCWQVCEVERGHERRHYNSLSQHSRQLSRSDHRTWSALQLQ